MKLRLFAIRSLATRRIIPDLYFETKEEAKVKRDEFGKEAHSIAFGPDHWRKNY